MTDSETGRVRAALRGADGPRFVSPHVLARLAGGLGPGRIALGTLVSEGALVLAGHGLYANRLATPAVHPKELVPHLAPEAYASLHTVLGEHGVANNPSRTVYVIRARDADSRADDVRMAPPIGEYRILTMPAAAIAAGAEEDRYEAGGRYRQATPERALCDWVYLSSEAGGRALRPPALDFDLEDLDPARVERLAAAMGIAGPMAEWLALHAEAQASPGFAEQADPTLGY